MTARVAAAIVAIGLSVAGALRTSAERASIDLGHPTLTLVPGAGGESAPSVELGGLGEAMMARLARRPLDEEGWRSAFHIATSAAASLPDSPAIAGRYVVDGRAVRFVPALPISDDVDLDATVDLMALQRLAGVSVVRPARRVHATLSRPRPRRDGTTRITAVYPTSGVLPVNLLKFYVY